MIQDNLRIYFRIKKDWLIKLYIRVLWLIYVSCVCQSNRRKIKNLSIPRWRSHPIHENRATKSIWTEPCNPLLSATKSTKRATSA